ncbi:unnamed protein product [Closterium sp. NIES-65]|nr:unnamed protein product [Closterium sp. NIES-65]
MTIPNPIFPSASRADVRSRVPSPYPPPRSPSLPYAPILCSSPRSPVRATAAPLASATRAHHRPRAQRKEAREELQGEVAAMRRVGGHAHVVALRALFEDAESVHLVMDLCAHGDLYDYLIARTTLPEPLAADVTRSYWPYTTATRQEWQILLALHHCHASGVVHRDIKPENILLAAKDEAAGKLHLKLADFGLAVMLRAGQQAVGMYGSAVYMSPEVVCRRPYGAAVDLWGLGVILYTALSGYMPFWGSTDEQLFFRILRNQPDFSIAPWPSVAPAAIDLVRWLLSSDPAHRPSAAAALHHPWLAQHCGREPLPSPRPAPSPCVPVGAPGWAGEGGVEGGREGKREGERVKAAAEAGGGAAVGRGMEGVGSGRGGVAGGAAAAAGGSRDTEMGGVEPQRTSWDGAAGSASGAAAVGGKESGWQQGKQEQQGEAGGRQEQGAGAAAHGSMDVDSQQGASTAQQGQSTAQQGGRQKQPKAAAIQLPVLASFTGPASPLFSSPTSTRSAAGGGVFLFTARPASGSTSHAGSGGGMWERESSKAKHKEQQRQQVQRHSHAHKQQEQQRGAAAAAGSKDGHKEGPPKAPVEAAEHKARRSSHFRFFSPKRKARRSHVVVSTTPLPAPPPPPLSSPSPSQSPLGVSEPPAQATPPASSSSTAPMASITVPLVRRQPPSSAAASPTAAATDAGASAPTDSAAVPSTAPVVSVTIPVIPPKPPLDPTQELPSVPEIQARLSGPDGSIPVSSLFSFLRPLNPMAARKSSSSSARAAHPNSNSSTSTAPPSFLYSPREPLKSAHHHHSFSAVSTTTSSSSSGGLLPSSNPPRAPTASTAASEPSFGLGRLARPLHGMAALMRPASPSASSPALAPSPSDSPQHSSMGVGRAGTSAHTQAHDEGSTGTVPRTHLTTSASAPNVAGMPGSAAAASGPAVPHAPRRARGLSSIVKAFASLSTAAAGPLGNVGSGQQHSGVSMGAVGGGGGGGRESARRGEDLHKGQQENGDSLSVSRSEELLGGGAITPLSASPLPRSLSPHPSPPVSLPPYLSPGLSPPIPLPRSLSPHPSPPVSLPPSLSPGFSPPIPLPRSLSPHPSPPVSLPPSLPRSLSPHPSPPVSLPPSLSPGLSPPFPLPRSLSPHPSPPFSLPPSLSPVLSPPIPLPRSLSPHPSPPFSPPHPSPPFSPPHPSPLLQSAAEPPPGTCAISCATSVPPSTGKTSTVLAPAISRLTASNRLPHLLLYGPPGTGKTSTVLAVARQLYGAGGVRNMCLELNASDERGIDVVRQQVQDFASTQSISFGAKAAVKLVVLDEADAMTKDAQFSLRRVIEKYTRSTRFCLICNHVSKIIPALQSRCTRFRFAPLSSADVTARLRHVIQEEGLDVTDGALSAVVTLSAGDMRRALNILQSTHMSCPNTMTEEAVYASTGNPMPKDIQQMAHWLLNEPFCTALQRILRVKEVKGLALIDIVRYLHGFILTVDMPAAVRIDLFDAMADIEYRLTFATSEKVQLGALVGAFTHARTKLVEGAK